MGSGKKKSEIKKIEKDSSRMPTFKRRRQGLFKKAAQLEALTGAQVAIVGFMPGGQPYKYGNVAAMEEVVEGAINNGTVTPPSHVDHNVNHASNATASSSIRNEYKDFETWLQNIDVEECNRLEVVFEFQQQLKEIMSRLE